MPTGPVQPARVQVDLFEITCPSGNLAKLDLNRIGAGEPSTTEAVKRMGEFGTARILSRMDRTVNLADQLSVAERANVPVVQEVTKNPDGAITPSVNYRSSGLTMKMSGSWLPDEPERAMIQCEIDLSSVVPSQVVLASGVRLPAFVKLRIERTLMVQNGKSAWAISNDLPVDDDEHAMTTAAIARLTFVRLPQPSGSAATEAAVSADGSPPSGPQQASVQVDMFEVVCSNQQLAAFSLDAIRKDDPSPEAVLDRLSPVGTGRMLARVRDVVDLTGTASLTAGARLPVVKDVKTSAGGTATPSVNYQQAGLRTELTGRWQSGHPQWADINCQLRLSSVAASQLKDPSGTRWSAFVELNAEQRLVVEEGQPLWTMGSSLPEVGDEEGFTRLTLTRLVLRQLPGPGAMQTADNQPAAVSSEARRPQPTNVQVDVFALVCTNKELARLDLDKMSADNPTADAMLGRLRALGDTRLLARINNDVDLPAASTLSHGSSIPRVQALSVNDKGVATPSVTYQDTGVVTSISGQWCPDNPSWANVNWKLEMSNLALSQVKVAPGVTLPTFAQLSATQRLALENSKPAWLMHSSLPELGDEKGRVNVVVVRLAAASLND